jgi:hypothetical protein
LITGWDGTAVNRRWRIALALIALVAFTLSFFSRMLPQPAGDDGVFQSVAYRLLAGDRLYIDVYDNKDPLFYYFVAATVAGGPLVQYLAELSMVLGTAGLTVAIARRCRPETPPIVLIGIGLAAAYVTSGWFWCAGMPATPGTFFAMLAIAAIIFDRPAVAGLALGATLFTNVIYFPVPAWFVLVFCLLRWGQWRSRWRSLATVAAAGAVAAGAVLTVLLWRGELQGYFAMLGNNVRYSQDNWVVSTSLAASVANHLSATWYLGKILVPACLASLGLLIHYGREAPGGTPCRPACLAAAWMLPMLLLESAAIVFFDQHLGPWRLLLLLALALVVWPLLQLRRWYVTLALAAALVSAVPWTWDQKPVSNPLKFAERVRGLRSLSPETVLLRQMAGDRPATYARLGSNEDWHHARGTERYRLACPEFQEYQFYAVARLQGILRCAMTADFVIARLPRYVVSADTDWLPPGARVAELNARWLSFIRAAERALEQGYDCVSPEPDLQVCRRRRPSVRGTV